MTPEMLNLLGCNKDNFKKLLKNMSYKIIERSDEVLFKYIPISKNKKISTKKTRDESPFGILKNLNFN